MISKMVSPEVTILIPTKNEEISIEKFINWVKEGFTNSNVCGEILIADSSTDKTAEIAESLGANVLKIESKGLGNAYREALPYIKGKYVIVGDADCTYDFRNIEPFLEELRSGKEFVMGSRFKGYIEKKSMPLHHQYFGTPLTTWFFTKMLNLPFTDIHCGMRGATRELMQSLPFDEPGWEYAPEMIIQACKITSKYAEVPISFYKEPEGRLSHFKRGKFSFIAPFKAGFGAVRVTLLHSIDRLLRIFGLSVAGTSTVIVMALSLGNLKFGNIVFSSLTQVFGFAFGLLGWVAIFIGNLMSKLYKRQENLLKLHNTIVNLFFFLSATFILLVFSLIFIVVSLLKSSRLTLNLLSENQNLIISIIYILTILILSLIFLIIENYFSLPSNRAQHTLKTEIHKD